MTRRWIVETSCPAPDGGRHIVERRATRFRWRARHLARAASNLIHTPTWSLGNRIGLPLSSVVPYRVDCYLEEAP